MADNNNKPKRAAHPSQSNDQRVKRLNISRDEKIPNAVDGKKNSFLKTDNQKFAPRTSAVRWFTKAVNGISSKNAKTPEGLYTVNARENPFYGELALFGYDAKHKDTLPYWDAFPLIIVTKIRPNGFSGLNLHYMPPQARKKIIKYMIHYKNKSQSPLLYAHKVIPILQSISQSDIGFCYKNYLGDHVRTKFVTVGTDYWELACELPLQEFRKASAREVWADRVKRRK